MPCVAKTRPLAKMGVLIDYEQFCGAAAHDKSGDVSLLPDGSRISCEELNAEMNNLRKDVCLIDCRDALQFDICRLDNSTNIPLPEILNGRANDLIKKTCIGKKRVYLICRRGNDSQVAVDRLVKDDFMSDFIVKDVKGGLTSWAKRIDPDFPIY